MPEAGALFVCGTPIGNLEDITYRAVRILQEADLIAAEDTRRTKVLLDRYQINTPLTSYHKFNIKAKTGHLISLLLNGKRLALVSDSGMPGISDPGYEIIKGALEKGIEVVPVPGPTALISALAVSGLPADNFLFLGFLPKKPGKRRKILQGLTELSSTLIIYESPYRILKCLEDIKEVMGERQTALARELTKKFEEVLRGRVSELIEDLEKKPRKGEMVLLVEGLPRERSRGASKKKLSRERSKR